MNYSIFYFPFSIFYFLLSVVGVAQAHEEGATNVTLDNALGPILAFVIIILAVVVAKRIKKIKITTNKYD